MNDRDVLKSLKQIVGNRLVKNIDISYKKRGQRRRQKVSFSRKFASWTKKEKIVLPKLKDSTKKKTTRRK